MRNSKARIIVAIIMLWIMGSNFLSGTLAHESVVQQLTSVYRPLVLLLVYGPDAELFGMLLFHVTFWGIIWAFIDWKLRNPGKKMQFPLKEEDR